MLHIIMNDIDIQISKQLQQASCEGGILLRKPVRLPCHTDHQLFALHRAGEPVA